MQKIQDGRHLVQNEVSLQDMLKKKLLLKIQANCMPNLPENKQMTNFLHIFFQFFFSRGRVWGLYQK